MKELIDKIGKLTDYELQDVMKAIEKRFADAYPEWEVIYIAMHKDPKIRKQEYEHILELMNRGLEQKI